MSDEGMWAHLPLALAVFLGAQALVRRVHVAHRQRVVHHHAAKHAKTALARKKSAKGQRQRTLEILIAKILPAQIGSVMLIGVWNETVSMSDPE